MRKSYKRYARSDDYTIEIWDRCENTVEIRNDGERMRLVIDVCIYDGQGGGSLGQRTVYVDGREQVRAAWKQYRKNQTELIKNGSSPQHYTAVEGCDYLYLDPICSELYEC